MLEIQISLLRSFLDDARRSVGKDIARIENQNEKGRYKSFEDYERALDAPIYKLFLSSRAVAYELSALVERTFHQFASRAWRESKKYQGPKHIMDLPNIDEKNLRQIKMVSDLPFSKVIQLIERYYDFNLSDIEGWKDVGDLREIVNSFKHRDGFKHPRDIDWSAKDKLHPRDTYGFEEAKVYIEKTRLFLRQFNKHALRSVKNRKP